jgi:ABC-2 type transport system ATP-binding protein
VTTTVPETEAARPALRVFGVGRAYDELVALRPLDLEVRAGELVALVGPNGAGKTTLLAMTAGLLEPTSGEIHISGSAAGSVAARAATSYIPDTPVLYDDLSLDEHLEYVARLHGANDWHARGPELLERLALQERGAHIPSQFSRGMRQKASIALGFIRPFSLLIADEPFDGLDPPSRTELVRLLQEASAAGAAVIVSTHRVEATRFATRFVALFDGDLKYDGPPDPAVFADFTPASSGAEHEWVFEAPSQSRLEAAPGDSLGLSTASFEELRALGLSATQALELLRYRAETGLRSVDELAQVSGFTPELIRELKQRGAA